MSKINKSINLTCLSEIGIKNRDDYKSYILITTLYGIFTYTLLKVVKNER